MASSVQSHHESMPETLLTCQVLPVFQIKAAALGTILTGLDQNTPARSVDLSPEENAAVRPLYLLTMKPMV